MSATDSELPPKGLPGAEPKRRSNISGLLKWVVCGLIGFAIASLSTSAPSDWSWPVLQPLTTALSRWLPSAAIEEADCGLNVLYDARNATVDLVFIHGINGHSKRTWTSPNGVFWPQDLLPYGLPESRIFSWGFDSSVASTHPLSTQFLHEHAQDLVVDLTLIRTSTETSRRPIIFLAHSLGGLVVKSALVHSDSVRPGHLEHHKAIKLSTSGIYFFGTPHQGGTGADLGTRLVNVAAVMMNTNTRLLGHISRDSEALVLLNKQFLPFSDDFEVKYLYETKAMQLPGGGSVVVVPKSSAVLPGTKNAEVIGIQDNHRNMVRFGSAESKPYQTVRGLLQESARQARVLCDSSWRKHDTEQAAMSQTAKFKMNFNLPFQRNPIFVGREGTLQDLHTLFRGKKVDNKPRRRVAVVSGIGGMGKTQLVNEYVHENSDEFSSTLWIRCSDRGTLHADFSALADDIDGDPEHSGFTQSFRRDFRGESDATKRSVELVKRWLSQKQNDQWLLILDNFDAIEDMEISTYLPTVDWGSVVITTRRPELGRLGHHIELDILAREKSVELLLRSAGLSTRETDPSYDGARRLALDLGYLPLALDQAGAYIHAQRIPIGEYFHRLLKNYDKVSSKKPMVNWPYQWTLSSVWELSLEAIRSRSPTAVRLLSVIAILDYDRLDPDIFTPLTKYSNKRSNDLLSMEQLAKETMTKLDRGYFENVTEAYAYFDSKCDDCKENLDDTLELLFTYSFAKRRANNEVAVHPLILQWARQRLNRTQREEVAADTIRLIANYNRYGMLRSPGQWITQPFAQRYYPSLTVATNVIIEHLNEVVRNATDYGLLLAVEAILVDSYFARIPKIVQYFNNLLIDNCRIFSRAVGTMWSCDRELVPAVWEDREAAAMSNLEYAKMVAAHPHSVETLEILWLWEMSRDNPRLPDDREEMTTVFFGRLDRSDKETVSASINLLAELERLEKRFPDESQDQIDAKPIDALDAEQLEDIISRYVYQVTEVMEPALRDWQKEQSGLYGYLSPVYAFHPLFLHLVGPHPNRARTERIPGMSFVAFAYKVDFFLTKLDNLFCKIWDSFWRSPLADECLEPVRLWGKSIISPEELSDQCRNFVVLINALVGLPDRLKKMRVDALSLDHPSVVRSLNSCINFEDRAHPTPEKRIQHWQTVLASLNQRVDKGQSPAIIEYKTHCIESLAIANLQLVEAGEHRCITRELVFFAEYLQLEQRQTRLPEVYRDDAISKLTWLVMDLLRSSSLCRPGEDDSRWLLRSTFTPRQERLFQSYLASPWDKHSPLPDLREGSDHGPRTISVYPPPREEKLDPWETADLVMEQVIYGSLEWGPGVMVRAFNPIGNDDE